MKPILFALALGLFSACNKTETSTQPTGGVHAADNTTTATDQRNNDADLTLVKEVRRALMDDGALSTAAKNLTAVARDGTVTLKGVVPSQDEADRAAASVQKVAGVQHIDNQITVKAN